MGEVLKRGPTPRVASGSSVLTPGKVYLKLLPTAFAVSIRELDKSERGDIGRLVLRKGTSLTGTVRDAAGTPLAGVIVNAAGFPREPKTDALYDDSHWDNRIDCFSRSSVTGPNGEFTLAPLPPGFYRLLPVMQDDNLMGFGLSRPLPAPFTPLRAAQGRRDTRAARNSGTPSCRRRSPIQRQQAEAMPRTFVLSCRKNRRQKPGRRQAANQSFRAR